MSESFSISVSRHAENFSSAFEATTSVNFKHSHSRRSICVRTGVTNRNLTAVSSSTSPSFFFQKVEVLWKRMSSQHARGCSVPIVI